MDLQHFIEGWIAAANQFDVTAYLAHYQPDAVLDDPSVGRKFKGHVGIGEYFESYFTGYKTHTKLVKLVVQDNAHAHLEVEFTGEFPQGKVGGTFDVVFREGKIAFVKADLVNG